MDASTKNLRLILRLITDDLCLRILLELQKSDLYSDELSRKLEMPKSTVWGKLKELEKAGIVDSYTAVAEIGKQVKTYKFRNLRLNLESISDFLRRVKNRFS